MTLRALAPAAYYRDLPTSGAFDRTYETSEFEPMDGSNAIGRTLSPFVFRVLPPAILAGDTGLVLAAETRDGTSRPDYAGAIRSTGSVPPSQSTYDRLASVGNSLPGLTEANGATLAHAFAEARNASVRPSTARPGTIVPGIVGDLTALATLVQLKAIVETPPLLMLINPQSMTVASTKVAQFQERNRYGYIYQAWGEELTKLSLSFRIGAYVSGARDGVRSRGVKRASRNDSASFQQLMSVLTLFHSAGYIHDTVGGSRAYYLVGNVAIEYDQRVWVGHLDSFSFGEDETQANGGLSFEIEFTAIREYDLATPTETVSPLESFSGSGPGRASSRGTLSRSTNRSSGVQFFSAPTVGIAATNPPPQPYSGATVSIGDPTPAGLTSRRR